MAAEQHYEAPSWTPHHVQEEVPADAEPTAPLLGHEANEQGWGEAEDWEGEEEEWPPAEDEVGVAPAWDAEPPPASGAEPEPSTLVQIESTPNEEEVWMEFDEEEEEEAPAPGEGFADADDWEADEERLFGTGEDEPVEVALSEPSAKRLKTGQETRAAHLDTSSLGPTPLPMTYVMRTQVRKGDTVRILSGRLYGHSARVTAEVGYRSLECQLEETGEKVCLQREDVQLPEPQKEERDPALSRKDIRILKELQHSRVPTKGVSADWRPKVPTPQQAPPRPRGSNSSKGEARTLQPAHRARSGKGSSDATSMSLSGLDSVLNLACQNIASGSPVEGYTSGKPSAPLAPAVENPVAAADEPSTRRGKGRGRGTARAKAAVPKQLPATRERFKSENMRKLRAQSEDPRYSGRGIV